MSDSVVTITLPLDMRVVTKIMSAVAEAYPDAKLGDSPDAGVVRIVVPNPEAPR